MSEIQDTYDFLLGPRRIADAIWRKDLRRQELRSCLLPSGIAYDGDRVQTSPEDSMARVMAEVDELDQQIDTLRRFMAMEILRISRAIDRLDDPREATVLDAFYLGRKSMQEIAEGTVDEQVMRALKAKDTGQSALLAALKERSGSSVKL